VQKAFQGFMKKMQASAGQWQQVRKKLSAAQLDLLDAYKGSLSYFS